MDKIGRSKQKSFEREKTFLAVIFLEFELFPILLNTGTSCFKRINKAKQKVWPIFKFSLWVNTWKFEIRFWKDQDNPNFGKKREFRQKVTHQKQAAPKNPIW